MTDDALHRIAVALETVANSQQAVVGFMRAQHDAIMDAISNNEQKSKLQHFAEWCFANKNRPEQSRWDLAAVRMYLEETHTPEDIDVYMAERKRDALHG